MARVDKSTRSPSDQPTLSAEPHHSAAIGGDWYGFDARGLVRSAWRYRPHPPARGIGACVTRIRIDCGHLVTIRRDEYIEGRSSIQYFVFSRTIRIESIGQFIRGRYMLVNAIEGE